MHVGVPHLVEPELINHSAEVSQKVDSMVAHEVYEQVTLSSRIFEYTEREVLPHQSLPVHLLYDIGLRLISHVIGARESFVPDL